MATYDTTRSAGPTHQQGSVTNTDTSPFEAYDEKVAAADSADIGRTVPDRGTVR